ncbi:MAG: RNA polymerase sigma factor [Planctomycetota bacterium]|jgi:RNA polymerase sigma-70 factor (ECF subfamily)
MEHSKRLELFETARDRYSVFLTSVLWKLTGDREIFTEALQYSLFSMWRHTEKLEGEGAKSYIYRIALSANSKAWRNRIGKNGEMPVDVSDSGEGAEERISREEQAESVRRHISELPKKQGRALIMRYLEQKDYQTISEALGCSMAGARSNVARALETLRSKLAVAV